MNVSVASAVLAAFFAATSSSSQFVVATTVSSKRTLLDATIAAPVTPTVATVTIAADANTTPAKVVDKPAPVNKPIPALIKADVPRETGF